MKKKLAWRSVLFVICTFGFTALLGTGFDAFPNAIDG